MSIEIVLPTKQRVPRTTATVPFPLATHLRQGHNYEGSNPPRIDQAYGRRVICRARVAGVAWLRWQRFYRSFGAINPGRLFQAERHPARGYFDPGESIF